MTGTSSRRPDGAPAGAPSGEGTASTAPTGAGTASARPVGEGTASARPAGEGTVGEVFAALADPTRRQLLDLLAQQPGATATVLAAGLPISRQAVVKHLTVLTEAGLVTPARSGREVRYALRPAPLTAAAGWLNRRAAQWDHRLASIKQLAEGAAATEQGQERD